MNVVQLMKRELQLILSLSTKGLFNEQFDDKTNSFMSLGARLSASLMETFFMDEGTVVTTNAVLSIKRIDLEGSPEVQPMRWYP